MSAKDVKIQLFEAVSRVVAPIVAAAASKVTVAVDPTMQDAQVRQLNLFAFEVFQVHYNALKLAYENNDPNQWPDPVVSASAPVVTPTVPSIPIPNPGSALSNIAQIAGQVGAIAAGVAAAGS